MSNTVSEFTFLSKNVAFSSSSDEWTTPQWLFDILDDVFCFTVDAAATSQNTKCKEYFSNGLEANWDNHIVFCNPPYTRKQIVQWTHKFVEEKNKAKIIVGLLPARTETRWFHDNVFDHATILCFIKKRLRFSNSKNSAPFPSCLAIYSNIDYHLVKIYEYISKINYWGLGKTIML